MNKVTTINLNGRAYQLEEHGFDALRKYLDTAAAKLAGNPDKDEIMADFEQAIADKFDQKLNGHKNVVSEREIEDIIAGMGPVDAEGGANGANGDGVENTSGVNSSDANAEHAQKNPGAPKRLYRITEGEWLMGVCNGLAAYFNIDVTLVRIVWILLTVLTHGFWIIAYIALAFIMPPVRNEEEYAAAHGWTSREPLSAHDFIEEAKKRYAELHDQLQKMHDEHKAAHYGSATMNADATTTAAGAAASATADAHDVADAAKAAGQSAKEMGQRLKHQIKQEMRQKKQQMKQEWRQSRRDQRYALRYGDARDQFAAQDRNPGWIVSQVFLGIFSVVVSVALAALAVGWGFAIVSLVQHGNVFGYTLGASASHSIWVSIAFLTALFYILVVPFASLLHNAWGSTYYPPYPGARRSGRGSFGRFLLFVVMLVILVASARELFPQVASWWSVTEAYLHSVV